MNHRAARAEPAPRDGHEDPTSARVPAASLLNTPLFVGFLGYVSKLWLAHDEHAVYRGVYEWDGPARADAYARALSWVLAPVCVRGSIRHRVLPGQRRDELLRDPGVLDIERRPTLSGRRGR